jgi:hypothetical protein
MLRVLLHYLLPLLLPFIVYFAYIGLTRGRAPGWLDRTPWVMLLVAGVVLLVASLVTWSLWSGSGTDEVYLPPRIEDGEIVPGRTLEVE